MRPQLKVAFSTPTEIFEPVPLYTFRHPYHPLTYLHISSYILQNPYETPPPYNKINVIHFAHGQGISIPPRIINLKP